MAVPFDYSPEVPDGGGSGGAAGSGTGAGSTTQQFGKRLTVARALPRNNSVGDHSVEPLIEITVRPTLTTQAATPEGYPVPPGARVAVQPDPSNTGISHVAQTAYAALNGPRSTLAPGSVERPFAGVRNTSELKIAVAVANEGVIIRVYPPPTREL